MPEVKISYQDANDRYPEIVEVVMRKLRAGTSKRGQSGEDRLRYQNAKPERLAWSLVWGHYPEQVHLEDDGKKLAERTLDEAIQRQLLLVKNPCLRASIGEWSGDVILGFAHELPEEIENEERTAVEIRHASAIRWEAMTPEERQVDEISSALAEEMMKKAHADIRRKARSMFGKMFSDFGLEDVAASMDDPKALLDDLEEAVKEFLEEYAANWTEDE